MTDYSLLKVGDVIRVDDHDFSVEYIERTPGGGIGMGEYPENYKIMTNRGFFTWNSWIEHTYKPYSLIGHNDVEPLLCITRHFRRTEVANA